MFRTLFVPAAIAALLSTTAAFAETTMVKEIDVQIELTALQNDVAATRFANFEADLENALTARLVDRIAEEGVKITVDISEVELSNSFLEKLSLADTRLVGDVKVTDENNNTNFDAYELAVDINTSLAFMPKDVDVTTLAPDSDVYYAAMIASFADAVVTKLDE